MDPRAWGGFLVLAAWGAWLAGCAPPDPPPSAKARPGAPRPEYHQPPQWWRDHHPLLMREPSVGLGLAQCRVCHQPARDCAPCHAYLGLPPGEADRD